MRRHLFTIAAAVSLVLCVALCVLWARSYFRGDLAGFDTRGKPQAGSEWFVRSNCGVLYFARNEHHLGWDPSPAHWFVGEPDRGQSGPVITTRPGHFNFGPFGFGGISGAAYSHTGVIVPHWFLAAVTALPGLAWLR